MTFNIANGSSPQEVLRAASRAFGEGLLFTTGFGREGSVLLHMIAKAQLPIRCVTLDTGFFFPETYLTWQRLEQALDLKIEAVRPELSVKEQAELHGDGLWERQPDRCCEMRKVAPLRAVLKQADAWITGIRAEQTAERQNAAPVEVNERFGVTKINPLLRWSSADIKNYLDAYDVPYNPLFDQGFPSIGCAPCTRAVADGGAEREGRWFNFQKQECGIHWSSDGQLIRIASSKGEGVAQ